MRDQQHIAVEAIYGAALDPSNWSAALQATADCSGDVGAFLAYTREDGRWQLFASKSLEALAAEYNLDWGRRDIRAIRAAERGHFVTRDVVTDRDLVSEADMASDPQYTELLPKYGIRYFAACYVSPNPGVHVAISIHRQADRPAYSDVELQEIGRLARHIETALKLSTAIAEGEMLTAGLSQALDSAGIGVVALDGLCRVSFANTMARRLLGEGVAATLPGVEAVAAAVARLAGKARFGSPTGEGPILIDSPLSARPLVARLLPLNDGSRPEPFSGAVALALIYDPGAGGEIDPGLLRDLFGLTLSEARVAALVGGGRTLRDTGDRLGLKEQSVRSLLKRVFDKTQVSRQAELTVLLQRLRLTS